MNNCMIYNKLVIERSEVDEISWIFRKGIIITYSL